MKDKEIEDSLTKLAREVSKKADTRAASRVAKKEEREDSDRCLVARQIFFESLEMYQTGEYTWKEMVEDLSSTLSVMDKLADEDDEDEG